MGNVEDKQSEIFHTQTTANLDRVCREWNAKKGVCCSCKRLLDVKDPTIKHADLCIFSSIAISSGESPIWYITGSTDIACRHCSESARYDCPLGSFCEEHAQKFITGQIELNPSDNLLD